jgi:hypothetical protein
VSLGAIMEATTSIRRIWEANEVLWNQRVIPLILEPLEKKGGLSTSGLWNHILATAFGRSQKTFESIQILCSPSLPRRYWDDAFVLTRSHYETFITMEWIAQDPDPRSQLFWDEYALKQAHFLEALGMDRDDVRRERRDEIIRERDEALKRHGRRPGTLQLLPSLQERVRSLAEPLKKTVPNLEWEYEFYYRDVSGFAHPSGWGTALSLTNSEDSVPTVECSPRVGYNAVMLNGGWFFRILRCWNRRFRIVSEDTVDECHREWIERSGGEL